MERIRKTKKSPYFIANILLLLALLLLLVGYLNKLNSEAKNKNQSNQDFQNDFFSTFENGNTLTPRPVDKNITIEEGQYVKIIKSCDIHFVGNCVRARACPSLECPTVADLRNEMVLKHPTQAEKAVKAFETSPRTISLVLCAKQFGGVRQKSWGFQKIVYHFDDDSSLEISGRGKNHKYETFWP
jgi:hypothetical protein